MGAFVWIMLRHPLLPCLLTNLLYLARYLPLHNMIKYYQIQYQSPFHICLAIFPLKTIISLYTQSSSKCPTYAFQKLLFLNFAVGTLCSARWILAYVGIFGFACVYNMRINMSLAIVCMVKTPHWEEYMANETYTTITPDLNNGTMPINDLCGTLDKTKAGNEV